MNLYGTYWILSTFPVLVTISIIVIACICMLPVGREFFEGLGYNTSLAAQIGDVFLGLIIMITAMVLQRNPVLPGWVVSGYFQFVMFDLAALIAVIAIIMPAPMVMDKFHNVFVVPLFVYFLTTSAPVLYYGGTTQEWCVGLNCFGIWIALLIFDAATGRLPQQQYLYEHHGIRLPAWEGKFKWLPPK